MMIMMMGAAATKKKWFLALIQFNQTQYQLLHKHRPTYCTVYIFCERRQPLSVGAQHFALVCAPVQLRH